MVRRSGCDTGTRRLIEICTRMNMPVNAVHVPSWIMLSRIWISDGMHPSSICQGYRIVERVDFSIHLLSLAAPVTDRVLAYKSSRVLLIPPRIHVHESQIVVARQLHVPVPVVWVEPRRVLLFPERLV